MKVFVVLIVAISGLGFMILIDVMAKPTASINVSEFKPSKHAFTDRVPQVNPLTNNTDLSTSGQGAKKRPVRKASIKKLKKPRKYQIKYQINKKKLLLALSILRKH